ncbi:unnamed protein product [Trichobilharzia szidati]|nr:unnamed protein product [Trichobilharzia szidati]
MSVTIRDDQTATTKLVSTSLIKSHNEYSTQSCSVTSKPPCVSRGYSSLNGQASNSVLRNQVNGMMSVGGYRNSGVNLINNFETSPLKQTCNTIYAKLESKPLSINTINSINGSIASNGNNNNNNNNPINSQTLSFRPSSHSLSAVLPPLLTLSQHTGGLNDQFQNGICDSAYASGINSSSSSSASSPAVGELISPAKSCSSTSSINKTNKTSPIRRKIHFIPIRPQSQQLPPVVNQPTRQRFLSANNGTSSISSGAGVQMMNGFQFKSHSENVIISRMSNDQARQPQKYSGEEMNETILLHDNDLLTTDILTPVYIQLDHEGRGPTEGLMFTLPPGTAIIQTNGDIGRIPFQTNSSHPSTTTTTTTTRRIYISNGNRIIPTVPKSVQVLQPLKVMNVINQNSSCTDSVTCSPAVNSEMLSSSPYSCNSSPTSVVSPLSADVFLPMQQVEVVSSSNIQKRESPCMNIYQFDAQNEPDMCIEEEIMMDDERMTNFNSQQSDTMTNIICMDECVEGTNESFSSSIIPHWSSNLPTSESMEPSSSSSSSSSKMPRIMTSAATTMTPTPPPPTTTTTITRIKLEDDRQLSPGYMTTRLPPLSVDVMKSSNRNLISSSSLSTTSNHTTSCMINENDISDTDFPITTDDNFDSSFDAMMNSIDITTFLPGTFQSNEEQQFNGDYDNELNRQLQSTSYDLEYSNTNEHAAGNNSSSNNNNTRNNDNTDNHLMKIDEFDDTCQRMTASPFIGEHTSSTLYSIKPDIDFSDNHESYTSTNTTNATMNRTMTVSSSASSSSQSDNNNYFPHKQMSNLSKSSLSQPSSTSSSSCLLSQASGVPTTASSVRMNSLEEILNSAPQIYSSSLADLDSLDKSSLFVIKPDWSVVA